MKLSRHVLVCLAAILIWLPVQGTSQLARYYHDELTQVINAYLSPKLSFYVKVYRNDHFVCGGTVIDPLFVLTAANCVEQGSLNSLIKQLLMNSKQNVSATDIEVRTGDFSALNPIVRKLKGVPIMHPKSEDFDHDSHQTFQLL